MPPLEPQGLGRSWVKAGRLAGETAIQTGIPGSYPLSGFQGSNPVGDVETGAGRAYIDTPTAGNALPAQLLPNAFI